MDLLFKLMSPGIFGMIAVAVSIFWMLRDEKDKTRPLLVIALIINLFYGFLLTSLMGREDSLLPWKYDLILLSIDQSLGVSAALIARSLQGGSQTPLLVIYDLLLPMMIAWFLTTRIFERRKSLIGAYIVEMVTGPLIYAILPACGPAYALGAQWLHPQLLAPRTILLAGMPNAFPSLHVGTAFVLVMFAEVRWRRALSLAFLLATACATLATGEHYVVDLVPGLAFGCFAANLGLFRLRWAFPSLCLVLAWSIAIRLASAFLIANPFLLRSMAAVTIAFTVAGVAAVWRVRS